MFTETRNVNDIIELIKDLISLDIGMRKVYDKDVAEVLDISPSQLASSKSRNTIPYIEIVKFALMKDISLDKLLKK